MPKCSYLYDKIFAMVLYEHFILGLLNVGIIFYDFLLTIVVGIKCLATVCQASYVDFL